MEKLYDDLHESNLSDTEDVFKYLDDKFEDEDVFKYFGHNAEGIFYRGMSGTPWGNKILSKEGILNDKRNYVKVFSKKYYHIYIGHYGKKEYVKEKEMFLEGYRRSRPNGRKWCYISNKPNLRILYAVSEIKCDLDYATLRLILEEAHLMHFIYWR